MWERSSQDRYHLTLWNLCNFGTSNTLLYPLWRLNLKCSRMTIHLFLLWSIILWRRKSWAQQSQRWYNTYLLQNICNSQWKLNEFVFIFFCCKGKETKAGTYKGRYISVPEERGEVWKKEVRKLLTLGLVPSYAVSFFMKLNLFGLWLPHVSDGNNLCFTWQQLWNN